jgi:lysyl-tRNA synthetase, class II
MASIEEIKDIRLKKIEILEKVGIYSYPSKVEKSHTIFEVKEQFKVLESSAQMITIVGRIMSVRGQGALAFVDLYDGTARMQALLKADENIVYSSDKDINLEKTGISNAFDLFKETIDQSDFIQVTGIPFVTKRGEETILCKEWKIVAKSLRPIPDEWYGIKDEDERYRNRYIDILLNEELKNQVIRRSTFWQTIRNFLLNRDFIEVETPVLETMPGGADARPFITFHNALDMNVYLRISAGELWQKKLLVSGIPRTFEIGRIFRNEGMSNEHAQDYTQLEFYMAYSNYHEGMKMVREMYIEIAEKVFGSTKFEIAGSHIDLAEDWNMYDYVALIEERSGVNVLNADVDELIGALEDKHIKFDKKEINRERATDLLWKDIRKTLIAPGFLINVPMFLEPLAKESKDKPGTVERFQIVIAGTELGKGFSELNDPLDQRRRFEHQEKLRDGGDDEAQMKDEGYIEAMEYGMPPAFGFGLSERVFSVLSGVSIREAQIFPLMKPKESKE